MHKYVQYTGLLPTEFIEEAEAEELQGVLLRKRRINIHLSGFYDYLKGRYTPSSCQHIIGFIRSFYNYYDIQLPKHRIRYEREPALSVDDLPGREEIKRALTYANPMYRALIVLMASSGMGISEAVSLTVKDFFNAIEYNMDETSVKVPIPTYQNNDIPEGMVATWNILRVKTQTPYTTFSTPESIRLLIEYLQTKPPKKLSSPLFIGKKNTPLNRHVAVEYFSVLNKKCGWGRAGNLNYFRSHNLRKFFASTLERSPIEHLKIRRMMGHSVDKTLTGAYFKLDVDDLRESYKTVVPLLTFTEIVTIENVVDDERIQELQKELKAMREWIQIQEKKRTQ